MDSFSKNPFLYKISSKAPDLIIKKIKSLFPQYGPPKRLTADNVPPFSSETHKKFLQDQNIDHITSSPHYPKLNGFIECQIKTIKTALSTSQTAGQSIEDLQLNIKAQPIGPHLPPLREILHNGTKEHPRRPSQPVNMEQVCNYFITRKQHKKENHDQKHNIKPQP